MGSVCVASITVLPSSNSANPDNMDVEKKKKEKEKKEREAERNLKNGRSIFKKVNREKGLEFVDKQDVYEGR